ncbi:hypothetical protein GYMLUDRAFT_43259 [Collybiopsis luxurians FD-317 M1]|uniref:Acetyl-CoA synthetase-like protein n=1 Tax=Collybiopsis luxurians FD-317 M1 TaxID=944289 RepID=A0A0D0BBS7_9AGAR|nr:hypothetical protein GYMLUDRAFT_43259 [Collybiopsis luxurians FD-317 M1]
MLDLNPLDKTSRQFEDVAQLPTLQGVHSSTFHRPPLDGSLTVPELFAWHARNSPNHPVFIYPADDENQDAHTICYPEVYKAIGVAAKMVKNSLKLGAEHHARLALKSGGKDAPVIGILAVADTISYYTLILGIMHLGFTPFPISTRNSALGVAHLLKKAEVVQLYVSNDSAMQKLAHDALRHMKESGDDSPDIINMVHSTQLYHSKHDPESDPEKLKGNMSLDSITMILHSSGSTAFPKPIKFLGRNFLKWGVLPYYGEVDICDMPIACHSLPMFHAMGTINIVWPVCTGSLVACFAPVHPPVLPTPDVFFTAMVKTKSQIIYCVPAFIEAWAQKPENLPILQRLKAVVYGGAPLNKSVGDLLASAGLTVTPFYGLTETGSVSMFVPNKSHGDEWAYFKISPQLDFKMIPQQGLENVFEPILFATDTFSPHVVNTIVDGRPAYATSDLLEAHPTSPNMFRVFGRADDQLMLSTGEKTNPGPLESILLQDPHVSAALMFGRGRFQNGILVQPTKPFDPNDEVQLAAFRNKIWPSVRKVNNYAPSHSRIFKEMIIVTSPSKPLEFTPKGTPRRQVCIDAYTPEIDAVYEKVKDSSQPELALPTNWSEESTLTFVRKAVLNILPDDVDVDDDIFQHGCDSLQATWIRNTLLHALRVSNKDQAVVHGVPLDVVYENPSIRSLATFMFNTMAGSAVNGVEPELKAAQMLKLVEKYKLSGVSVAPVGSRSTHHADVVLLTGTTGRFGCHILAQLLAREDVVRVYAFNRENADGDGSVATLERRQIDAFKTWGLDEQLLRSGRVVYVVGRLDRQSFGLERPLYEELLKEVDVVIHNAWRVDFNLKLPSFEPLFLGIQNLLKFCRESRSEQGTPRAVFVSSGSSAFTNDKQTPWGRFQF